VFRLGVTLTPDIRQSNLVPHVPNIIGLA